MKQTRVAKRYAKALFDLSLEQNLMEDVANDMKLIEQVCAENRQLGILLANPVIVPSKKSSVFNKIFENKIQKITERFFQILSKKGRASIIPEIAIEFKNCFREFKNILPVQVATATTLDDENKTKVLDLLTNAFNMEIELDAKVQPDLIGGIVISINDQRLDASIAAKLKRLQKEMISSVVTQ
ncbi:MAG: ATP synthase F1 subunit delta [Hyphomicrobiales bacterium]